MKYYVPIGAIVFGLKFYLINLFFGETWAVAIGVGILAIILFAVIRMSREWKPSKPTERYRGNLHGRARSQARRDPGKAKPAYDPGPRSVRPGEIIYLPSRPA